MGASYISLSRQTIKGAGLVYFLVKLRHIINKPCVCVCIVDVQWGTCVRESSATTAKKSAFLWLVSGEVCGGVAASLIMRAPCM